MNSSSNNQIKALKILLYFVQSDSKLFSEFITLEGYKLLTKALSSSQIQPSCSMLMVYTFYDNKLNQIIYFIILKILI